MPKVKNLGKSKGLKVKFYQTGAEGSRPERNVYPPLSVVESLNIHIAC